MEITDSVVASGLGESLVLSAKTAPYKDGARDDADDAKGQQRSPLIFWRPFHSSRWNDREIARRAGVSQPTVGTVRTELSAEIPQIDMVRLVERGGTITTAALPSHRAER